MPGNSRDLGRIRNQAFALKTPVWAILSAIEIFRQRPGMLRQHSLLLYLQREIDSAILFIELAVGGVWVIELERFKITEFRILPSPPPSLSCRENLSNEDDRCKVHRGSFVLGYWPKRACGTRLIHQTP